MATKAGTKKGAYSRRPPKAADKKPSMGAEDHRAKAAELRAKSRLHDAKADMIDVKNPPPKGKGPMAGPY